MRNISIFVALNSKENMSIVSKFVDYLAYDKT